MNRNTLTFGEYSEQLFHISHSKEETPNSNCFIEHIHESYEIYYFISGDVTYLIEGQAYQISPHDLLIINSRELHKPVFNSKSSYERIVIHFSPAYLTAFQTGEYNFLYCFEHRKLGHYNKIDCQYVIKYNLHDYFNKIFTHVNTKTDEDMLLAKTYFIQFLIQLNRIFKQKKEVLESGFAYDKKIDSIMRFINKNINQAVTLDMIQKNCFVNKYYLCHLFKENTGFTVIQYIKYKRVMLAKELLLAGKSATETCHEVGFQDYSNFYKTFRKLTGMTPKQFSQCNSR